MPPTIYDVAHRAGVSITTVSRVLNKHPSVMEVTREKVNKVVTELNFSPNPIARGLVKRRSSLIELSFSSIDSVCDFRSNWYLEILNGVNEVVQEGAFGLLVNTLGSILGPEEVYQKLFRHVIDGILLVSPALEEDVILRIVERGIPVVLIGHRSVDPRVHFMDVDNAQGVQQALDHLAGLGHERIAFISGPVSGSGDGSDRLNAFKKTMAEKGFKVPKNYIEEKIFNRQSGYAAMRKLLVLPIRPTAVFASDDLLALGAWRAIEEAGLKVGRDISLVGFDDIAEASRAPYSLTTVRQDFRELGVKGARILLDLIRDPGKSTSLQVLVPTGLITRESSGPVRSV